MNFRTALHRFSGSTFPAANRTASLVFSAVAATAEAVVQSTAGTGTKGLLWSSPRMIMSVAAEGREVMQVKKLSENAILPVRGSEHAAGFDLASAYEATVPAGRQALIKTDLSIAIPPNTYARIAPRSGLAVKKMIDVGAGVVDYDYRGPVGVVLFNHGTEDFKVNKGDRVAQLILERICMAELEEVTELSETIRGSGGFGSTGVAREPLTDVTAVPNGYKKFKMQKPQPPLGSEYVQYLLGLIQVLAGILGTESSSAVLTPLRGYALKGSFVLGDALEGILDSHAKTNNKRELETDLAIIKKEVLR